MEAAQYAKGITAEDLRRLLEFWPKFMAETDEVQEMFVEIKDKLLNEDAEPFSGCH